MLEKAHASLAIFNKLAEESKNRSPVVKSMQMICHTDVQNIAWFLQHAEASLQDVLDINQKLVDGILATMKVASDGGKRDNVISSLRSALQEAGYEINSK